MLAWLPLWEPLCRFESLADLCVSNGKQVAKWRRIMTDKIFLWIHFTHHHCKAVGNKVHCTGCPNKFGIMFWSSEMNVSEGSIVYESYEKIVFCSKKLLFQPFFLNWKIENGFLKQLFSNLLNRLLHNKMEKSCFKKPFSFLQFRK